MDNLQEYKESGILELYVYGLLPQQESIEVTRLIQQHPELKTEVEEIEKALKQLSADYYPRSVKHLTPKITKKPKKETKLKAFGWLGAAAAIALLVISGILFFQNQELQSKLSELEQEKDSLERQIIESRGNLAETNKLLEDLRARDITRVPLNPQKVSPDAFVMGYLSKGNDRVILDARELPAPPQGMVYQVWSLQFDPLRPTSMGLLENFEENEEKIFYLSVEANVQGFGITLEPAGGSESPNLEQLYVLGAIEA
ncbi:anti-sigma factor domain-containing protein [Salegentibacter sp. F14]